MRRSVRLPRCLGVCHHDGRIQRFRFRGWGGFRDAMEPILRTKFAHCTNDLDFPCAVSVLLVCWFAFHFLAANQNSPNVSLAVCSTTLVGIIMVAWCRCWPKCTAFDRAERNMGNPIASVSALHKGRFRLCWHPTESFGTSRSALAAPPTGSTTACPFSDQRI